MEAVQGFLWGLSSVRVLHFANSAIITNLGNYSTAVQVYATEFKQLSMLRPTDKLEICIGTAHITRTKLDI